jgi:hypothetical protein
MIAHTRTWMAALIAILLPISAGAHEIKTALSEVLFNPRSGHVEIAHRFVMHDAEHAMRAGTHEHADLAGDPEARRQFASQVAGQFVLADGEGRPYPLELVGSEIEGGYLWVYQEIDIGEVNADEMLIRQDALRERWPDQLNRVNVRKGEEVRSLAFTGEDTFRRVRFD